MVPKYFGSNGVETEISDFGKPAFAKVVPSGSTVPTCRLFFRNNMPV
jgi:hypothetical protein